MKKRERLLSIMAQMKTQEQNSLNSCHERGWSSSYDVARWQSVTQPHAWRMLKELFEDGMVFRVTDGDGKNDTVRYFLTPAGRKRLHSRRVSVKHARDVLVRYKTARYRRGLAT